MSHTSATQDGGCVRKGQTETGDWKLTLASLRARAQHTCSRPTDMIVRGRLVLLAGTVCRGRGGASSAMMGVGKGVSLAAGARSCPHVTRSRRGGLGDRSGRYDTDEVGEDDRAICGHRHGTIDLDEVRVLGMPGGLLGSHEPSLVEELLPQA